MLAFFRDRRAHVVARYVTLVAGVSCSLIGWLAVGLDGLATGLVGTLVVVAFFWSGMIPLFIVQREAPQVAAGLGVLLLTYTLRLALVLAALRVTERLDLVNGSWLGVTIIACALVWCAVHVTLAVVRGRPAADSGSVAQP